MAWLRLFASAREAAGVDRTEIDGRTVAEVLEAAVLRFGPDFEAVLGISQVWCNGEPIELTADVGPEDEVAVLPPISGGT